MHFGLPTLLLLYLGWFGLTLLTGGAAAVLLTLPILQVWNAMFSVPILRLHQRRFRVRLLLILLFIVVNVVLWCLMGVVSGIDVLTAGFARLTVGIISIATIVYVMAVPFIDAVVGPDA